jgi:polyisoprenoid-binding protein YceI
MISNVRGHFNSVKGTVVYDPENVADTSIQAEIDVNSLNTRDETRDTHVKSADFFNAEKYPSLGQFEDWRFGFDKDQAQRLRADLECGARDGWRNAGRRCEDRT